MIKNMVAIEYNLFMTMLKLLNDKLPSIAKEYNVKNIDIPVCPAYPADLTDMKKPSIIVRKVDNRQSKVGLGNVLGQFFNSDVGGYSDLIGKRHDVMFQFDTVTSGNIDRLLFESMVSDIFNNISFNSNGMIDFLDFTHDENNPEITGSIKLIGDPSVTDVFDADSTNKYFIGSVRHKFALIQTIVPKQEYVDLSKWIKQTYTIKV